MFTPYDYYHLEPRFQAMCLAEGSEYLPNIPPVSNRIDYVFITMEPSLSWKQRIENAGFAPLAAGFHNFSFSIEDFILHYCIRHFLCRNPAKCGSTYHITDICKGAMTVDEAEANRMSRWDRWFPLLVAELNAISYPSTQVIAVGNEVYDFLLNKDFGRYLCSCGFCGDRQLASVLHYSRQASSHRLDHAATPACAGVDPITMDDIKKVARDVLMSAGTQKSLANWLMNRLPAALTNADKNLICTYLVQFEAIQ